MTRSFTRSGAVFGAIALTTFMLGAVTANAGTLSANADGIAVKYSQDELNSPADAERLYRKLRMAARKACGLDGGFLNLPERTHAQVCADETLASVVQKINRPLLTALHDSKTKAVG